MTTPPSYRSFDGQLGDHAIYHRQSFCQERDRASEQEIGARYHAARNEELRLNQLSRDDHRNHARRRRSSSSHSSGWSAKLILEGLKSNLLGSGSTSRSGRDPKARTSTSRTKNLDLGNHARDVHYTIHNHWHDITTSEPLFRATSWPNCQPFEDLMSGALPSARVDMQSTACNTAGKPWYQSHHIPLQECVSASIPNTFEQYDPSSTWGNPLGGIPRRPLHKEAYPCPARGFYRSSRPHHEPTSPEDFPYRRAPNCADFAAGYDSDKPVMSDANGHERHETSAQPETLPSNLPKPERVMPDAATVLAMYNKRWEFIETVQQPYLHELPGQTSDLRSPSTI